MGRVGVAEAPAGRLMARPLDALKPSSGVDRGDAQRLWTMPDAHALAASDGEAAPPSSRLDTELGYGLTVFGGGFTGTPHVGFGMSDGGARDWRLGWRLTPAASGDTGFEVSLDATRREAANDDPRARGDAEESDALVRVTVPLGPAGLEGRRESTAVACRDTLCAHAEVCGRPDCSTARRNRYEPGRSGRQANSFGPSGHSASSRCSSGARPEVTNSRVSPVSPTVTMRR